MANPIETRLTVRNKVTALQQSVSALRLIFFIYRHTPESATTSISCVCCVCTSLKYTSELKL